MTYTAVTYPIVLSKITFYNIFCNIYEYTRADSKSVIVMLLLYNNVKIYGKYLHRSEIYDVSGNILINL